jgi:hypothetical protein
MLALGIEELGIIGGGAGLKGFLGKPLYSLTP